MTRTRPRWAGGASSALGASIEQFGKLTVALAAAGFEHIFRQSAVAFGLGAVRTVAFVDMARRLDAGEVSHEAATLMPRHVVESTVLAGNTERCAQQLARGRRPEITHVALRPHAVPGDDVRMVIRKFIERVVPCAVDLSTAARGLA